MNEDKAKAQFREACTAQLIKLYTASKNGKNVDAEKYRVQGFMHAGEVLGVISKKRASGLLLIYTYRFSGKLLTSAQQENAN